MPVKKLLVIPGVGGLLLAMGACVLGGREGLRSNARRAWKEKAIAEISACVANAAGLRKQIAELRQNPSDDASDTDRWLSEGLLLMRNGDWLAYTNTCRKQAEHIHDLFLARGSDGQWYYSTYHFCVGMVAVRTEEQPEDLAAFARTHHLRTFDGRSDECLRKTWPPDAR